MKFLLELLCSVRNCAVTPAGSFSDDQPFFNIYWYQLICLFFFFNLFAIYILGGSLDAQLHYSVVNQKAACFNLQINPFYSLLPLNNIDAQSALSFSWPVWCVHTQECMGSWRKFIYVKT